MNSRPPLAPQQADIEALYERHFDELVRFMGQRAHCRDIAVDLVQELFLRLLSRGTTIAGLRHARGFLFCAARHLAIEALSSPRWQVAAGEADGSAEAGNDDAPEARMAGIEAADCLRDAIDRLAPRCREAFLLHRLDGLAQAEVAKRMGISVSSVEKHVMRALALCRERLAQRDRP